MRNNQTPKRGRPNLPAGTHLSAFTTFRAHPDEKAAMVRAAKKEGQKLGAWIRGVLVREAKA